MPVLRRQFDQQREAIVGSSATTNLRHYKADQRPTKADKHDYLAGLLLWDTYTLAMKDVIAPIIFAIIAQTGQDATQQVGQQPSQFDPATVAILNYYQTRAQKIATDVNAETEKQLRASLAQGIDDGESDDELRARIEEVMGAALTYRADRIARTEVTRAQGFGDVEAWRQSGVVTGKEWYTAGDERVCIYCNSLDGAIVELDTDFLSLGDVMTVDGKTMAINYDDVGSPPLHTNCRCSLEPVTVSLGDL